MHRRSTILAMGLTLSPLVFAQTRSDRADVKWGPELERKETGDFKLVMDHANGGYYLWLKHKDEDRIAKMNEDLTLVYDKPMEASLEKSDGKLEKIIPYGDRFLVFTSEYSKKAKSHDLYVRPYAESTYTPLEERRRVASIPAEKKDLAGHFNVGMYQAKQVVRIEIEEPKKESGETPTRTIFLDRDMDQVEVDDPRSGNGTSLNFPEDVTNDDMVTLKDGTCVYLGRRYPDKKLGKRLRHENQPDHTFVLLVFEKGDPTPTEHPIEVAGKFLQDLKLMEDINGDLICTGFYGAAHSWSTRGVFFLRIARASKEIVQQDFKEFSDDFITEGLSDREESKARKKAERKDQEMEVPYLDLDHMVQRPDGSVVMVAEQYRSWTRCVQRTDPNTHFTTESCKDYYYYGDIIVLSVDKEGRISWTSKIPKRQLTVNDGGLYSSYVWHLEGDRIQFLFNDHVDNLSLVKGDKVKQTELKGKDAVVSIATVESDGSVSREMLYSVEHRGTIMEPAMCHSYTDDTMLLYTERGSTFRFGNVTFH